MKKTLIEYYRASLVTLIALILLTPMLFILTAYGTILFKYLRALALWLY